MGKQLRILLCVSFLDFLLFIASLPDLNFFFSLFPFGCVIFSIFDLDYLKSSSYFHPVYFFLGSMGSSRFLW